MRPPSGSDPPGSGDRPSRIPASDAAATPSRAKSRRRTAFVVTAPIVSVATLMLGLRVGAGDAVRAAIVFAAPPGRPPAAGAPTPLAWQVLTYLEDRGVRETVAIADLTVIARSKGKEARWTGASNADGIAEASLAIPDLAPGDPVEIEVRAASEREPLALGTVDLGRTSWSPVLDPERAAVRPSRREGAIGIDVVVEGERLVVGFETPIWARVTAPSGDSSRVSLEVTPEPGLLVVDDRPKVGCDGWAELPATAQAHVVGLQVEAKASGVTGASAALDAGSVTHDGGAAHDGDAGSGKQRGLWFGALPVAPGAFFVGAPRFIPEGKAETAVLVAPNPRDVVYAEVDDERGRVFAAALSLRAEPGDPVPRARFAMPPLAPGLHWIVVSGEPRGAERLSGATIAKPFLVGGAPGVRPEEACSLGPWLARRPASGFPRWLALDGMATRGAENRARHRAGLFIGLVSLLAAAVLEVLLLTAAAREARAVMLLAELDEPEAERARLTAKPPGGGLAIALLVAILGFALLAALMIAKA